MRRGRGGKAQHQRCSLRFGRRPWQRRRHGYRPAMGYGSEGRSEAATSCDARVGSGALGNGSGAQRSRVGATDSRGWRHTHCRCLPGTGIFAGMGSFGVAEEGPAWGLQAVGLERHCLI